MVSVKSPLFKEVRKHFKTVDFRTLKSGVIEFAERRIPKNPQTDAQQAHRALYGGCVEKWRALSQAEKDAFNELARPEHISGWNYFLRENIMITPPFFSEYWEACNLDAWSGNKTDMSCSSEQPHNGSYSLRVYSTSGVYGTNGMYHAIDEKAKNRVILYVRIIAFIGTYPPLLYIKDAGGAKFILNFRYGSSPKALVYAYDGGYYTICEIVEGQYYKVTIDIDDDSKKWRIYVDDDLKVDWHNWNDLTAGKPAYVEFRAQRGSVKTQYYSDDLEIFDFF